MSVIPLSWFRNEDVVSIAREMIGMELFSITSEGTASGIITETEAYAGVTDKASHAWNGRRTARTEIMYRNGGTVYVYLCYGIHSLLNIVTNRENTPHAVLIRAIEPTAGQELMAYRLNRTHWKPGILYGPGNVAKAMGIHYTDSGMVLNAPSSGHAKKIWIEAGITPLPSGRIVADKRIGVDYAKEDALLPYRFTLKSK